MPCGLIGKPELLLLSNYLFLSRHPREGGDPGKVSTHCEPSLNPRLRVDDAEKI